MAELTDLEHAALGAVWRAGSCTPYEVRKKFLASPTPSWSGSAGTIYPLMRRLERMGLVASRDADRDRRGTKLYRVTPAGRRALLHWLRPPLSRAAIFPGVDPIRTRLLFIDVLSEPERREFLDVVDGQLGEAVRELRTIEREAKARDDRILVLATRGALHVARARQRWFKEVREEL